jgi:uncharacterized protein (TIGR03435 family)
MKRREKDIEEHLGLFSSLSEQGLAAAEERASHHFHSASVPASALKQQIVIRPDRRWRLGFAAAVAGTLLIVFIGLQWRGVAPAVFEEVASSRKIQFGDVVRSGSGGMLNLADGSRVEMRAQSELVLERAEDGVRIRLETGDVIVNAAKQHGHLYVQTKDAIVSVVGTVFLVKAEAEGSRVGVIQGEVHVQQGPTDTSLMPGEQVMTKSQMEWKPVSEEISWSRQAGEHVALLQQSTAPSSQGKPRLTFEVASVKPVDPASMRGGHEGHQLDRVRYVDRTELLQFIVRAYLGGSSCVMTATPSMGQICPLLAGALPDWVRKERFEIQASMAVNSVPSYTLRQTHSVDTPEVNQMLQVLLEDRFRLKVHWEMKEIPVYTLTVGKNGPKLKSSTAESVRRETSDGVLIEVHGLTGISAGPSTLEGFRRTQMEFVGSSMKEAAGTFAMYFDRPVVDRTGLKGEYDFSIDYDDDATLRVPGNPFSGLTPSALSAALQAVGLKLESTKASVNILVVDHVEKPSEN